MSVAALSVEGLALQVGDAFEGLEARLRPAQASLLLADLGLVVAVDLSQVSGLSATLEQASSAAGQVASAAHSLRGAIDTNAAAASVVALGAAVTGAIASALSKLADVRAQLIAHRDDLGITPELVDDFAADFPTLFLDYAVLKLAEEKIFRVVSTLALFGVVERAQLPAAGVVDPSGAAQPFIRRRFQLARLIDLLTHPADYLAATYGFGTPDFGDVTAPADRSGLLLLFRLQEFFRSLGYLPTLVERADNLPFLKSYLLDLTISRRLSLPGVELKPVVDLPEVDGFASEVLPGWTFSTSLVGAWPEGVRIGIEPPDSISAALPGGAPLTSKLSFLLSKQNADGRPTKLLGVTGGSGLDVGAIEVEAALELANGTGEPSVRVALKQGHVVVDLSGGDGFLASLTGGGRVEAGFDLALGYSARSGLTFEGGSSLEVKLPLHVSFGGIEVTGLNVRMPIGLPGRGELPIDFSTGVRAAFGPFQMLVDDVGLAIDLSFGSGNLGIADISAGIKLPTGIAASIDGGAVSGGGFLSRDELTGRYSGAIELRVFSIGVKAFGLLDTKFPDGSEGVSFVVVIVAEFTPIQLGFGFTLLGVGGLLGLNRSVDAQALGDAVRTGSLEHLLFPRNPVQDAPAIIHDLASVFPATKGHFVIGPMAKLGWGTPTLISADLGIVLELPGPRIAVLGVVRMVLPKPDFALLKLQMAVSGLLDFPAKEFSLDASLYDSVVVGYPVSGDMAYRMGFGRNAKFLLSVGGFNTGFDAPPAMPVLRRAAVDLGVHGNPSLVASGYFALTSNTAQIGASIELNAHGAGIKLHGWLGFDVMFVFSPFSFTASISAGMRVSFHGAGIGITLNGSLSGPSPWHLKGKVCVSILWWDACLGVDVTFGNNQPAALPEMDPWTGFASDDGRLNVRGLQDAVRDPRSWAGTTPPAGFSVVSLSAAATAERIPIDPLASAELRQKVVPLQLKLSKFGEYKPIDHTEFNLSSVSVNGEDLSDHDFREEDFVPGHFLELSNAEKLSMPSYVPMKAGFAIRPDRVAIGSSGTKVLEYKTKYIDAEGQVFDNQPVFKLTQPQLRGLLTRSAAALGGMHRAGPRKYSVPGKAKKVSLSPKTFVVVDSCSSKRATAITPGQVSQVDALAALRNHVAINSGDQGRFRVVPVHAELP